MNLKNLTAEETKELDSRISAKMNAFVKIGGYDHPRRTATKIVATVLGVDAEELASELAKARNKYHNNKKADSRSVELKDAPLQPVLMSDDAKKETILARYRKYALSADFIPSDAALAYWTKAPNAGAFGAARSHLSRAEGFAFEGAGHGCWSVTKRPAPVKKTYTAEEVARAIKDAIAALSK